MGDFGAPPSLYGSIVSITLRCVRFRKFQARGIMALMSALSLIVLQKSKRNGKRSLIRITSIALPKSAVSLR